MPVVRDDNNGQGEEERGPHIHSKPIPVAIKNLSVEDSSGVSSPLNHDLDHIDVSILMVCDYLLI